MFQKNEEKSRGNFTITAKKLYSKMIRKVDVSSVYGRVKRTSYKYMKLLNEKYKNNYSVLVETYSSLFEENNCMYEEKENVIERLKYITAEKIVQNGFDYEKAIKYAETIFDTIKEYKKQIIGAINGNDNFPNDSSVGVVKKLNYPKK